MRTLSGPKRQRRGAELRLPQHRCQHSGQSIGSGAAIRSQSGEVFCLRRHVPPWSGAHLSASASALALAIGWPVVALATTDDRPHQAFRRKIELSSSADLRRCFLVAIARPAPTSARVTWAAGSGPRCCLRGVLRRLNRKRPRLLKDGAISHRHCLRIDRGDRRVGRRCESLMRSLGSAWT